MKVSTYYFDKSKIAQKWAKILKKKKQKTMDSKKELCCIWF